MTSFRVVTNASRELLSVWQRLPALPACDLVFFHRLEANATCTLNWRHRMPIPIQIIENDPCENSRMNRAAPSNVQLVCPEIFAGIESVVLPQLSVTISWLSTFSLNLSTTGFLTTVLGGMVNGAGFFDHSLRICKSHKLAPRFSSPRARQSNRGAFF